VRRTSDGASAFTSLPGAVNFAAEGTIIGDGRAWDTVQFVAADTAAELERTMASLHGKVDGDAYVMGVRASMDAITQG
jgi:hypothetical protein